MLKNETVKIFGSYVVSQTDLTILTERDKKLKRVFEILLTLCAFLLSAR